MRNNSTNTSVEERRSAESKALEVFSNAMIEKISKIKDDWKQPWFTEGSMKWPKNLSGREYNGLNAVMLMLHCEKNGYKLPVFMTFDRVASLNYQKDKQGKRGQLLDDKGEPLPHVGVNKGEKAFPVFITTFTCIDKDTKEKIKYDDYKLMSEEDKKNVNVYPKMQVYSVFNVSQTNIQEARPELYAKLEAENQLKRPENMQGEGQQFAFPAIDTMITEQAWLCPIKPTYQDGAYYSISKDQIVVPEKKQFVDGESFYGTLLHEMTHSTGAEKRLGRIKPAAFGSAEYAKEELVAELGASLVCSKYGIEKHVKDDSCAYIKCWLDNLKESPDFIKNVLMDVKRSASLITQRINEVQECLDQGKDIPDELRCNPDNAKQEQHKSTYYSQVEYIEDPTVVAEFRGNKDGNLISLASQYDQGDAPDLEQTHATLPVLSGETVLAENDLYAVVLNEQAGESISVWRKVPEQEVRSNITRYGLPDHPTQDVKNVAKEMVAEEFAEKVKDRIPCIETAEGVTYIQYNKEKDTLEAGSVTNTGMMVEYSIPYMHSMPLDDNIVEISEVIVNSELMKREQSALEAEENTPYNIEHMAENEQQAIVAEKSLPGISEEDVMTKLDNFMQQYYWAARREHGMRMSGFTEHEGKPALRLTIDASNGESLYIVTHEQDAAQKDHFFMHLMDGEKEIFKSRELPADRDDAYSFIHGAIKEQADYEYEKRYQQNDEQDKATHLSR
jgi:antirestriction protein ArdC